MKNTKKKIVNSVRMVGVLLTSLALVPVAPSIARAGGDDLTSTPE